MKDFFFAGHQCFDSGLLVLLVQCFVLLVLEYFFLLSPLQSSNVCLSESFIIQPFHVLANWNNVLLRCRFFGISKDETRLQVVLGPVGEAGVSSDPEVDGSNPVLLL